MPIVGLDDAPDVVAVLPTLGKNLDRYSACVDSLVEGCGAVRLGIVVVLNSTTANPDLLEREHVRVINAGVNLGWAGGLVFGASQSSSPYLWWMQDDVVASKAALERLVETLENHPELACVSPIAVNRDGLVSPGSCGGVVSDRGELEGWLPEQECEPDALPDLSSLSYLPSRALLVRRSAFDAVNGPNPRLYPAQYVDVDFSARLMSRGLRGATVTEATIRHAGNASTPPLFAQFLQSRNAQEFGATWFPGFPPSPERYFPVHALRPDDPSAPKHPVNGAIPTELVHSTAQSASDALTHLGLVFTDSLTEANRRAGEIQSELENAHDELKRLGLELENAHTELRRLELVSTTELTEEKHRFAATESELRDVRRKSAAEAARLQVRIDALESSRSWRITSPARWIVDRLTRRSDDPRSHADQ